MRDEARAVYSGGTLIAPGHRVHAMRVTPAIPARASSLIALSSIGCNGMGVPRQQWGVGKDVGDVPALGASRLPPRSNGWHVTTPSDPEAGRAPFERFYVDGWGDAARWAYGLTGDAAIAEELAQEAFVAIHRTWASLENPHGYLRRTIVNMARQHHRTTSRRERREHTTATRPSDLDGEPTVDLLSVLASLSYDQRAVLVLRYWLDWDEPSIAAALDCAGSTVRSHAKRGLAVLRASLEETP